MFFCTANRRQKFIFASSLVFLFSFALVAVFGWAPDAHAQNPILAFFQKTAEISIFAIVGGLSALWTWVVGGILVNVLQGLLAVASYNEFIGSTAVTNGWVVVRDVTNMFFVIYLLMIAIGTILGGQFFGGRYSAEQALPKFVMAAILINFSKTVCGIIIDIAQVVMLTFVGPIASGAGAGNFIAMLGIPSFLNISKDLINNIASTTVPTQVTLSLVLGAIFVTVALMIVVAMVIILLFRIVALWFYIVLSPMIFFLQFFPAGESLGREYWNKFTKEVMIGPIMAFFLWLSLTVVAAMGGSQATDIAIVNELGGGFGAAEGIADSRDEGNPFANYVGSLAGTMSFLLGIVMLMTTLKFAQEWGVAGGNAAGKAFGVMKDWATGKKGILPTGLARGYLGSRWKSATANMDLRKSMEKAGERHGLADSAWVDTRVMAKLAPTKRWRAETKARGEAAYGKLKGETLSTFENGGVYNKKSIGDMNADEIRAALQNRTPLLGPNDAMRAVMMQRLVNKGWLGTDPAHMAEDQAAVQETYDYLNDAPDAQKKFKEAVGKHNAGIAARVFYGNDSARVAQAAKVGDLNVNGLMEADIDAMSGGKAQFLRELAKVMDGNQLAKTIQDFPDVLRNRLFDVFQPGATSADRFDPTSLTQEQRHRLADKTEKYDKLFGTTNAETQALGEFFANNKGKVKEAWGKLGSLRENEDAMTAFVQNGGKLSRDEISDLTPEQSTALAGAFPRGRQNYIDEVNAAGGTVDATKVRNFNVQEIRTMGRITPDQQNYRDRDGNLAIIDSILEGREGLSLEIAFKNMRGETLEVGAAERIAQWDKLQAKHLAEIPESIAGQIINELQAYNIDRYRNFRDGNVMGNAGRRGLFDPNA